MAQRSLAFSRDLSHPPRGDNTAAPKLEANSVHTEAGALILEGGELNDWRITTLPRRALREKRQQGKKQLASTHNCVAVQRFYFIYEF